MIDLYCMSKEKFFVLQPSKSVDLIICGKKDCPKQVDRISKDDGVIICDYKTKSGREKNPIRGIFMETEEFYDHIESIPWSKEKYEAVLGFWTSPGDRVLMTDIDLEFAKTVIKMNRSLIGLKHDPSFNAMASALISRDLELDPL